MDSSVFITVLMNASTSLYSSSDPSSDVTGALDKASAV